MQKILTVSVAAYNVEAYLANTLESCLINNNLETIEVLVVNDGSTDRTRYIAKAFEERYPSVFRVIDKKNGGYGSTINTAIKEAKGKYLKQLDGDDWYQTSNLEELIGILGEIDADRIITPYIRWKKNGKEQTVSDCALQTPTGICPLEDVVFNGTLDMHSSAFRTELLRNLNRPLTENCFYTDHEYSVYPLLKESVSYVWHKPIYVYRLDRDGQSVSREGLRKHYKEHETVVLNLIGVYNQLDQRKKDKYSFFMRRLVGEIRNHFRYLCFLDNPVEAKREVLSFTEIVKRANPSLYQYARNNSRFVKGITAFNGALFPVAKWINDVKSK